MTQTVYEYEHKDNYREHSLLGSPVGGLRPEITRDIHKTCRPLSVFGLQLKTTVFLQY